MKKILFMLFFIVSFFPIGIEAKNYYVERGTIPTEILEPGDIIEFDSTSNSSSFYLFLENEPISDRCYGSVDNNCLSQFVVEERMLFGSSAYASYPAKNVYFLKLNPNDEVKTLEFNELSTIVQGVADEPIEDYENYFKSGDIIKVIFDDSHLPGGGTNCYVYDNQDNLLTAYSTNYRAPAVIRLPQIDGKDVYWITTFILSSGRYAWPLPVFRPFDYVEPKIELKCDKDSLRFGEKANCEICVECVHKLSNIDFSINQKQLIVSNINYMDVTNSSTTDNSFSLKITDGNICQNRKRIMTFEVEGTDDDTYLDNITLSNIEYVDEIVKARYDDLSSDLNIISTKPATNPQTGSRSLFIVIPIMLLIIVYVSNMFVNKKTTN